MTNPLREAAEAGLRAEVMPSPHWGAVWIYAANGDVLAQFQDAGTFEQVMRQTPDDFNASPLLSELDAALTEAKARIAELEGEGAFLIARLADFEQALLADDFPINEFMGHVSPSIARLSGLLAARALSADTTEGGQDRG